MPISIEFPRDSSYRSRITSRSPHAFVHDDTDGMFSDIEYASSPSMIGLEGHALLEGAIALDVDDVAAFVNAIERRQGFHAVPTERTREHVARAAPDTLRVHHRCRAENEGETLSNWGKRLRIAKNIEKIAKETRESRQRSTHQTRHCRYSENRWK